LEEAWTMAGNLCGCAYPECDAERASCSCLHRKKRPHSSRKNSFQLQDLAGKRPSLQLWLAKSTGLSPYTSRR
jgi:hypothetical protein